MDLVAGDLKEILLAISVDDLDGLDDRSRFPAHLALGGGLDPTWLDLFSEACRSVTDLAEPRDFLDARREVDEPRDVGDRTVERVDAGWVAAIAGLADDDVGPVAARWIDLLEEELGPMSREDKPWIRTLAADLVGFARAARSAPDVVFAWSI
ncbi:MAG TPA: hypothetical protein VEO91_00950 [Candidatus Limnocylindria bacterium]|nr:hypothetical protein [Candidatus Limnocylindria bacterium]